MNSDLSIAKTAAIEAGGIILNYYKADYEIKDKGYHNPVTTADNALIFFFNQQFIIQRFSRW